MDEPMLSTEDRFAKIGLQSWCFRPKIASEAMKLGIRNESVIPQALPHFLHDNANIILLAARENGLLQILENNEGDMGTSPDILGVILNLETMRIAPS